MDVSIFIITHYLSISIVYKGFLLILLQFYLYSYRNTQFNNLSIINFKSFELNILYLQLIIYYHLLFHIIQLIPKHN